MARIPVEELERIKGEIGLVRVVEASGVELRPHGKDLVGRCPLHDDKTPSLVVSPDKNLWHCLGACQTGGSVIDWVMKLEGVSFRHAVELLRERHFPSLAAEPSAAGTPRKVAERSTVQKLDVPFDADASDEQLLQDVVSYYHEQLLESPEALEYLEKRGLRDEALIKRFQLGFSNRTLGYRLPNKKRQQGEVLRSRLEGLGIYRKSGHEHLNGSIVFPIIDAEGAVVEMYGRKITSGLRKGTPLHLYLPGPHRGVWNLEGLRGQREVILCESLIDAATFWVAGFRHVTTSYGVGGFIEDHLQAFEQLGIERVLVAYDRDAAGDQAAEALARKLGERGMTTHRVEFPKGMDANEMAMKLHPATRSLRVVLAKAGATFEAAAAFADDDHQPTEGAGSRSHSGDGDGASPEVVKEAGFPLLAAEVVASPKAERGRADASGKPASLSTEQARTPSESGRVSPEPASSSSGGLQQSGDDWLLRRGDRRYRIRHLGKPQVGHLKLNLLASRGEAFHVDTLELYSARQRNAFIEQAASELGAEPEAIKSDVGVVLMALEERLEKEAAAAEVTASATIELSDAEQAEALSFLRSPKLLDRLLADFERCGVVGEETNKLMGYLAATSRLLDEPLAVVVQSSSAAGKSSLMDAVLRMIPEEERVQYSAMTGQSLYYMSGQQLSHKVLAISEEEGAERASYALKLLQSEGQLTIASTGKDPQTGRLVTEEYRVEGPVMIFLTTTAIDIDEELLNRCLVLSVDEGREQTRAIHELQRQSRTLAGVVAKRERQALIRLHQNAQRLLRPLAVVNPHAAGLRFPDHQTRTRRDHKKYLGVIEAVALLHQHQREVKRVRCAGAEGDEWLEYIEVEASDIEVANRLCREVLGKTLDELPPGTRRLLSLLEQMVDERSRELGVDAHEVRFSRREVREWTRLGDSQVRVHLRRLLELEYVAVHRGRQGQGYVYELCYAGEPAAWLGDAAEPSSSAASHEAATKISTSRGQKATSRGLRGGGAGSGPRSDEAGERMESQAVAGADEALRGAGDNSHPGPRMNGTSYRSVSGPGGSGLRKAQPLGVPLGTA